MGFLHDEWDAFAQKVIPAGAPAIQLVEMRKAFFAGIVVAFGAVADLPDDDAESEAIMNSLIAEFELFFQQHSMQIPIPNKMRDYELNKLKAESSGFDDESCLALLRLESPHATEVAIAIFNLAKLSTDNRTAMSIAARVTATLISSLKALAR